ncbi:hypothetical protein PVAP13_4KG213605 [Panicum virgatum]|uniref:Uncharacterized protein n=1 Tax=Panicum virgatum TaxID=38727 RepID=A0A8T0TIX3_PANVG|nr:hypothetical protein PVAP13_4KG213605 [Panicum virgatum]
MDQFGWLRHASRSLVLRSGEVAAQRSTWIRPNAPCSSTGMYIGDRWELVTENMTGKSVMIGAGILLLIHLILSR